MYTVLLHDLQNFQMCGGTLTSASKIFEPFEKFGVRVDAATICTILTKAS